MNTLHERQRYLLCAFSIGAMALGGCNEETGTTDREGGGPANSLTTPSTLGPESSPVKIDMSKGWCRGHGVPESVCTRCDASLIPQFKAANDWCAGHGLPETQCLLCNPEVAAKWAALNPHNKEKSPVANKGSDAGGAIRLERRPRLLTGTNDSLCQVDQLRVRFLDDTIVRKAGIKTEAVALRHLSSTIECPGEVGFDQTRLAKITPRVRGVVREATVEIGASVEAGDVLAVIDSPALGEAKSRCIRMRESSLLAKADYERVETIYKGIQRMLTVCTASSSTDDVARELLGVRIGEAKSRLLRAHAALKLARVTLEREKTLLQKEITSKKSYEVARSGLAVAEADFLATHEAIAFASERDLLAAARDLRVTKSDAEAAERGLQILGVTDAELAALGTEPGGTLSRHALRSPVAGRVVQRQAVVGELVEERDALYSVADLSTMWVLMDVYVRDLTLVRVGLPVIFTVDGLPGHSFEGNVAWVSDTVDDRTRTIKVRANLPNERRLLRANMFGLARIIVHDNDEVVSVSSEAVQTDGCCQLVFVKQDETLFEPRKVTLGASANGYVEILAGLALGESVVTVGSFLMKTEILKSNIGAGCCEVDPGR